MVQSYLEEMFLDQIKNAGIVLPERQYRFAAIATGGIGKGVRDRLKRAGLQDWRFDFAYVPIMLAIEVDGGTFLKGKRKGAHSRGWGYEKDRIRDNEAAILGWTVLRFTAAMVKDGRALRQLIRMLERYK